MQILKIKINLRVFEKDIKKKSCYNLTDGIPNNFNSEKLTDCYVGGS